MRNTLMLSDTAMLLLERRWDLQADWKDFSERELADDQGTSDLRWTEHFELWDETHQHDTQLDEVTRALLVDIWLVWSFPDLPPVRSLSWHLVLENDLIEIMKRNLIPQTSYPMFLRGDRLEISSPDMRAFKGALDRTYAIARVAYGVAAPLLEEE